MSPLLPVAVPSRLSRFDVGVDPKDVAAKEVVFAAEYFFSAANNNLQQHQRQTLTLVLTQRRLYLLQKKIFQSLILEILNMATNLVELRSTGRRELGP